MRSMIPLLEKPNRSETVARLTIYSFIAIAIITDAYMQDSFSIQTDREEIGDDKLREAVIARLAQEPKISISEIGVTASEGVITLSGYVDDNDAKHAAEIAVLHVSGVRGVANEIEVKPFSLLTDTDLAKTVLQVLESELGLDAMRVTVAVDKRWVTLTGDVTTEKQKSAAEKAVQGLFGVGGVTIEIQLKP